MYSNLLKPSYHGEKSNLFKSYDQARTSFVDSKPISKLHMRCKSITPYATSFLAHQFTYFFTKFTFYGRYVIFAGTRAPQKNHWQFSISWRHGSDCEIDIDLAGRPTEMSSMVAAEMGDMLKLLLAQEKLDRTRIFFFNILWPNYNNSSTWISLK